MSARTPGQWGLLSGPMVVACDLQREPGQGRWPPPAICTFGPRHHSAMQDTAMADARLISAAPDLLAVAHAIASCPQAAVWLARLPFGDTDTHSALIAAIKRAEGRHP